MLIRYFLGLLILTALPLDLDAQPKSKAIFTNAITMDKPPSWLKAVRVRKVTARMQRKLEWTIHRIPVYYHATNEAFAAAHGLGPKAIAVTINRAGKQVVHLGPRVTDKNFDEVFGHELVHVILAQKYKRAIPKWFEEGLANHYANKGKVDYRWLLSQGFPEDVRQVGHPFKLNPSKIRYHYKVSQALAEMLDRRCKLVNLISLSVGRSMEPFIKTYCEINDLNAEFKKWVKKKAKAS